MPRHGLENTSEWVSAAGRQFFYSNAAVAGRARLV